MGRRLIKVLAIAGLIERPVVLIFIELPRKTVEAVFTRIEDTIARLPQALRERTEALQALPEAERGPEMVEIDANVLVGLIQAAKEIATVKAKQAAKSARREAAAQDSTSTAEEAPI